ncbi:acetoacetate decarboxylase [Aeromicrobium flavum]|uniref:Acetoacetate decarboxylase n=1 Tax=Aeromicrobium flavum TaxID=416568 RepID=A0A512HXH4_9ACTN|nr:acetoacetate decarboxylase family protein [Aeromicrobium flavum]GEO90155.1 acetoacetate decarboxylase [Aeromicrobium flavum]
MDLSSFPSEPWDLHGHGLVTVGLLPAAGLTAPPGTRLVTLRGRAVVGAVLLRYTAPSPLTYHEIMAAVVVRRGLRFFVHIPDIWVDSPASRAGGRSLWAIPKELAEFEDQGLTAVGIAAASLRRIRGTLKAPARFRVAQERDERTLVTPVRGAASVSPARVTWTFDTDGPLAHLRHLRPLAHVVIRRFHLVFGPAER